MTVDDCFPIPYESNQMSKFSENRAKTEFMLAVAEPTRIEILKALTAGSKNVTELAKLLNVEIVNVSHHLGVLRTADVVLDEKHGRFVIYTLNEKYAATKDGRLSLTRDGVTVLLDL